MALTSPEFEKTLQKTTTLVLNHNREFGFVIVKEKASDKFHYSRPIGGSEDDNTALSVALEEAGGALENKGLDWFRLGSLHFHGYEAGDRRLWALIPSRVDISSALEEGEEFEIPQIEMIASKLSKTEVMALVYRAPATYSLFEKPAMRQELDLTLLELWRKNGPQQEVIKALQRYGFKAGIISFRNSKLTKESRNFIRSLGTEVETGL